MRVVCCRYRPTALRKPRSEGAEGEASLGRQMLRRRRRRRLAVAAGAPLRLGGAGSDDEAEGDEERGSWGQRRRVRHGWRLLCGWSYMTMVPSLTSCLAAAVSAAAGTCIFVP